MLPDNVVCLLKFLLFLPFGAVLRTSAFQAIFRDFHIAAHRPLDLHRLKFLLGDDSGVVIAKLILVPGAAGIRDRYIPGIFHVGQDGFYRMLAPCIFPSGTFDLFALQLLLDADRACPFQIPVKDVPDDLRLFLIDGKHAVLSL